MAQHFHDWTQPEEWHGISKPLGIRVRRCKELYFTSSLFAACVAEQEFRRCRHRRCNRIVEYSGYSTMVNFQNTFFIRPTNTMYRGGIVFGYKNLGFLYFLLHPCLKTWTVLGTAAFQDILWEIYHCIDGGLYNVRGPMTFFPKGGRWRYTHVYSALSTERCICKWYLDISYPLDILKHNICWCVECRDIPGFKLHGECTAMAQASLSQSGKVGLRLPPNNGKHDLVGGLEHEFYDFAYIGNVIIQTDFHLFQRGVYHQPVTYLENLNIF